VWSRDGHTLLVISGADAVSWLHAQTTCDVVSLASGHGCPAALLDRQGRLEAIAHLFRWQDLVWALADVSSAVAFLKRLESHRFLEEVEIDDVGQRGRQVVLQGPRAQALLERVADKDVLPPSLLRCRPAHVAGHEALLFRVSVTGEDGFVIVPAPEDVNALVDALVGAGAERVGAEAQEVLRVEWGLPAMGVDVEPGTLISETPFRETAVCDTKGCYQGQEVVTRLKAYGVPKQAMMGLLIEGEVVPQPGPLSINGKNVGHLTSAVFSTTLDAPIALAYLDKQHRVVGERLNLDAVGPEASVSTQIVTLPFCDNLDRHARARTLFEEALKSFEADTADEGEHAIELLKEAVELWPAFEDAYESLGVILHRHQRVDEAIEYMKTLERLRPDSIMAHANLSVFYMAKGWIPEAEAEKAQAAMLEREEGAAAQSAGAVAATERARIVAQARDRLVMFEEVLELDPEDPVALMGAGASYLQMEQYAEAIPFLERATRSKKDYSAAFLSLGKCQEFAGHTEQARDTYRRGIEAASRKGDLMPLREMERRLAALELTP
jgi:aminomethyltransferase